ncbi:nucleotidyltransferase family protein [Lacibacter sp.]|uniref:nucleotidyltransferase family protein n=1 Tax=Lacibacter sp. TaxID=1915409 RepID=UPI002B4B3A59|nr:nucleotidyltransferase family protein [Lacibacter sp.]HLP35789.1 nucleotidyltransferase family protein [Lacibacter sp.]
MANEQKNTTGLILLAAGASSRLGSPKQLLDFAGSKLLQHAIDTALASNAIHLVVVLGANADIIKQGLKNTTAEMIVNDEWKEGMASSIRFGLQTLVKLNPDVEAVVLMVADQPFVTADLLNELMELSKKEQRSIVASKYGTTFGTPVLFTKRFFQELLGLTGDVGAKSLVRKYLDEAAFIPFPKGEIDIDTVEDYENLSKDE